MRSKWKNKAKAVTLIVLVVLLLIAFMTLYITALTQDMSLHTGNVPFKDSPWPPKW